MVTTETVVRIGDKEIPVGEPVFNKSDRFWEWEYWAIKEHMAMTRCETLLEYVTKMLMAYDMPNRETAINPEIEEKPPKNDIMGRVLILRIPERLWERVYDRQIKLVRTWREFMLYPALTDGLIAAHYREIKGQRWPLEVNENAG